MPDEIIPPAATDATKTEAPKTDAPKTDAPKSEAPKTEAPKADAPKSDAPVERKSLLDKAGDKKSDEKKVDDKKPEEKKADQKLAENEIAIKLPEGFTAPEKVLADFKTLAKENGLKSEGAQKLVDLYVSRETERLASEKAAVEKQQDTWEAEVTKWPDAEEKLGLALKAVDGLGNENVKAFFKDSYVGSNPDIIQFLASVGKILSEPKFIESNQNGSTNSHEAVLARRFPKMLPK